MLIYLPIFYLRFSIDNTKWANIDMVDSPCHADHEPMLTFAKSFFLSLLGHSIDSHPVDGVTREQYYNLYVIQAHSWVEQGVYSWDMCWDHHLNPFWLKNWQKFTKIWLLSTFSIFFPPYFEFWLDFASWLCPADHIDMSSSLGLVSFSWGQKFWPTLLFFLSFLLLHTLFMLLLLWTFRVGCNHPKCVLWCSLPPFCIEAAPEACPQLVVVCIAKSCRVLSDVCAWFASEQVSNAWFVMRTLYATQSMHALGDMGTQAVWWTIHGWVVFDVEVSIRCCAPLRKED